MMRAIRRRLAGPADAGISLVELIVSIFISSIILTMVASFFIQTTNVTASAVQTRNSTSVASNSMNELSAVVRLATTVPVSGSTVPLAAINYASASKVVIYALVDVANAISPVPTQVTFDSSTGNLIETRCLGTVGGTGFVTFGTCAATSSRNLGGTFVAPVSPENSLFTYLDSNGAPIALSGGVIPSASLATIASIIVSVKVLAPNSKNAPVYLTSNVGMPNLGLQNASS